ncbi:MAG: DUF4956 domain-containing protein [Saprospiraceae bacterium]
MLDFEKYLNDFNSTINIWEFVLNLVIVAVVAFIIKLFYIRYGRAISDRKKFSNNFIPLAIGTLLIITVIKSSIALSLGLVGALSIVRFRSAIKDPEELTMLFLVIGLGLIGGANKPILAVVSFALIFPILYFNSMLSKNKGTVTNKAFLNINTSQNNVQIITDQIKPHTNYLEIKRIDSVPTGINASYFCTIDNMSKLQSIIESVKSVDAQSTISFVEQPDLLL